MSETKLREIDIEFTLAVRNYRFSKAKFLYSKDAKYIYDFYPKDQKQHITDDFLEENMHKFMKSLIDLENFRFFAMIFPGVMITEKGLITSFYHDFTEYFIHFFLQCNIDIYTWIYMNKISTIDKALMFLCKNFDVMTAGVLVKHLIIFDFNNKKLLKVEKIADLLVYGVPVDVIAWYNLINPFEKDDMQKFRRLVLKK